MPPAIFEPVHFEKEDRVRLWFKVLDLLPPDGDTHAEINHRGMYWHEDILKRELGRLTLATGYTEQKRIETFIMSAPEREILDLIKLVPMVRCAAHVECIEGLHFTRDHRDEIQREACAEPITSWKLLVPPLVSTRTAFLFLSHLRQTFPSHLTSFL